MDKINSTRYTIYLVATALGLLTGVYIITVSSRALLIYINVMFFSLFVFVPILVRIYYGVFDLAEPAIWFVLYYFTHIGFRALYNLWFEGALLSTYAPKSQYFPLIHKSLLVATISLVAFWYSYNSYIGKSLAIRTPNFVADWNKNRILPTALSCLVIGWGTRILFMFVTSGGISQWIVSDSPRVSGYIGIFSELAVVGILILMVQVRNNATRFHWLTLAFSLLLEYTYSIISGSRGQILFFTLTLLIVFYLTTRKGQNISLKISAVVGLILGVFLLIFPLLSAYKYHGLAGLSIHNVILDPKEIVSEVGQRQSGLDALGIIIHHVPSEVSYTYGTELWRVFIAWIPSAIWEGKPIITFGTIFQQRMTEGNPYGIATTLTGQFYWDFNIIGVIIGMSFVGIFYRFLYEYLFRDQKGNSEILLAGSFFPTIVILAEQSILSLATVPIFRLSILITIIYIMSSGGSE